MRQNVIETWLSGRGRLHFTLIDPEKVSERDALMLGRLARDAGSDALMLGGSTATKQQMERVGRILKREVDLPLIVFPNSADSVTRYADYVFFMMLMNSRSRKYLVEEQRRGAPLIKEYGLKPIPLGYIVVHTGKETEVERVGRVKPLSAFDEQAIISYALAAEYFGMDAVYLEAGSGAREPVPDTTIRAVKRELSVPLIVGGGIREASVALKKLEAGADVLVTGTVAERDAKRMVEIIRTVKSFEG